MAPIRHQQLQGRGTDVTGRNFSIIFGIIAFLVVATCLVWAVLWPKYRKEHAARASPTRYNATDRFLTATSLTGSPQAFPSHPAVRREFRKQASGNLRQYDPRTQTPFANTPPTGETISLSSLKSRKAPASTDDPAGDSDGLFTPARDRLPSRRGPGNNPNSIVLTNASNHPTSMDFSLAIPEPPLLRARPAGRAPPLRPHLEAFPIPRSGSGDTGDIAHPNKLFQVLEQRHSKTSNTSTATPSPLPDRMLNATLPFLSCSGVQSMNGPNSVEKNKAGMNSHTGTEIPDVEKVQTHHMQEATPLPKTQASSKIGTASSTDPFSGSTLSNRMLSITPPTSPQTGPETDKSIKSEAASQRPTPPVGFERRTPSSVALPAAIRLMPSMPTEPNHTDGSRMNILKRKPLVKARPERLDLDPIATSPTLRKRIQRRSVSSFGSMLAPLVKHKRPSIQVSSIYSRDTRGVSYMQSLASPAFSEQAIDKGQAPRSKTMRKASSLELLQCKIDNWNLDIGDISFPLTPSSELKRALSDTHVRSPTFPDLDTLSLGETDTSKSKTTRALVTVPKICVGRPSDDIFRDPAPDVERGRVLRRILDMETGSATQAPVEPRLGARGSAPGGADWI